MADAEKDGLRAEIERLRNENRQLSNEVGDLHGLLKAYREWVSKCPILETPPRS